MTASRDIEFIVSDTCFFRIASVERFAGGSEFVGRISLRSGAFGLHTHSFYFEDLDQFLSDMRRLYQTLSGSARLSHRYEHDSLSLTATSLGHISVSGHFERFDAQSQRLQFGFDTDQTFLPPFILSLESVCRALGVQT